MESSPRPQEEQAQTLTQQVNEGSPVGGPWRRIAVTAGRIMSWAVLTPSRAGLRTWSGLRPPQQFVLGFALYALAGLLLLSLPFAQRTPTDPLDNLFNVVSAISTTGLTTGALHDLYTPFGHAVLLALFQIGGIGFMTLASVLVIARGGRLSESHLGVLKSTFAVPRNFVMQHFIVQVVVFTVACEAAGTLLLWWRFAAAGVEAPLWSAFFHSVSAFTTAGFGLYPDSLERFAGDPVVCGVVGALSYLGAVGFIVVQDVWYSIKFRERMLTFTSRVIVLMTVAVFAAGFLALFFGEPTISARPLGERLLAAAFQAMTASSTAGFNTVPIGALGPAALMVLMLAMVVGASPSGTGGGIRTTGLSALLAVVVSVVRGREKVAWLGNEIPPGRVLYAVASATMYLLALAAGLVVLAATESSSFLALVFEAVSALSTVGLSMGVTAELSDAGKLAVVALMFIGRCGPLTIGLALLRPEPGPSTLPRDDLAV